MVRILSVLTLTATVLAACTRGDEPTEDLKKKRITADKGEIGKLLTQWHKDGSAAGNVGDFYDNRDGEHSPLDLSPWPQLQKVKYTDDDFKARRNWALMVPTRKHVTFGNSSTSGPPELNGSNPRTAYTHSQLLAMIEKQYLGNNVYMYPEHRDHDPGHNGVGDGYGDLYPTNTPYLVISQGSSGSDQPFMRAWPFALAALRPDAKKKLTENGMLMPTLQMVFRMSNKNLKSDKEYLTGKAHPTVFEGLHVDALKMVKLAHAIEADSLPPLVKLKVTKEEKPENGRDYFEPQGLTEQHSDTACVVSRIWRGVGQKRKLTVSAEGSVDLNKKPLKYTWVVLRGDEKRITITPNKTGDAADIEVLYHERRPIAPGSKMESNRVDIGVFAHNGAQYSAPAFVTFYSLDSESRTYDGKGRPVEVAYGAGEVGWKVTEYSRLFATLGKDQLPAKILGLTVGQRKEFARLDPAIGEIEIELKINRTQREAEEMLRDGYRTKILPLAEKQLARAKENKNEPDVQEAESEIKKVKTQIMTAEAKIKKLLEEATKKEKALSDALDIKREALNPGGRPFALAALYKAIRTPSLWNDHIAELLPLSQPKGKANPAVEAARKKLFALNIAKEGKDGKLEMTPAQADHPTAYERAMLEEFNAVVLTQLVLPGLVTHTFRTNFVDGRLTAPKAWRDVYRVDGSWTRYSTYAKPAEFTAEGWLVIDKDKGRPKSARTVVYEQAPPPKGHRWVNPNLLKLAAGEELITFEYDGETRKIKSRERK